MISEECRRVWKGNGGGKRKSNAESLCWLATPDGHKNNHKNKMLDDGHKIISPTQKGVFRGTHASPVIRKKGKRALK